MNELISNRSMLKEFFLNDSLNSVKKLVELKGLFKLATSCVTDQCLTTQPPSHRYQTGSLN